ncbi:MAG: response regulator, partial [Candidatus Latescibacterota bacterium]
MMTLHIICVDDQREVLAALQNDLSVLPFVVEGCESAEEAWEVMEDLDASGKFVALIVCDQVMPDKNGVDFLSEVATDDRFLQTRKMLLSGLATLRDRIRAINESNIDMYIEKPWDVESLLDHICRLVTEFVVSSRLD